MRKITAVRSLGILESSPVLRKWSKRLCSSFTTLAFIGKEHYIYKLEPQDLPCIARIGGLLDRRAPQLLDVVRVGIGIFEPVLLDQRNEEFLQSIVSENVRTEISCARRWASYPPESVQPLEDLGVLIPGRSDERQVASDGSPHQVYSDSDSDG